MKYNTGIAKDNRSKKEKEKDWPYKPFASGEVTFTEISFEPFSIQNQVQSSSCVWQAIAKGCEVLRYRATGEKINHSAAGYAVRSNKPGLGTFVEEGLYRAHKDSVAFEEDIPSEGLTEAQMNAIQYDKLMGKIPASKKTKIQGYVPYMPMDFDIACKELANGNVIPLLVRCNILEWNQSVPQIYGGIEDVSHEIAGIEAGYFTGTLRDNKGKKLTFKKELMIRIDDSWGNLGYENKGIRLITREFFNKYIDQVSMMFGYTLGPAGEKPVIPKYAEYGQRGINVKRVQLALKYIGYFPHEIDLNDPSNNSYGPITRSMVKKLQLDNVTFFVKRGTSEKTLRSYDGRYFGPSTIELLEEKVALIT